MSPLRRFRFWLLPPLLAAMAYALDLAVTLLRQAFRTGTAESLMLLWILAFVVVLPLALLVLPMASRLGSALQRLPIIPFAGKKIPNLGQ